MKEETKVREQKNKGKKMNKSMKIGIIAATIVLVLLGAVFIIPVICEKSNPYERMMFIQYDGQGNKVQYVLEKEGNHHCLRYQYSPDHEDIYLIPEPAYFVLRCVVQNAQLENATGSHIANGAGKAGSGGASFQLVTKDGTVYNGIHMITDSPDFGGDAPMFVFIVRLCGLVKAISFPT